MRPTRIREGIDTNKDTNPQSELPAPDVTLRRSKTKSKSKAKADGGMPDIPGQGELILLFVAFGYIVLGLLKSAGLIEIETPVIASLSLAGLFFALSDLVKPGLRQGRAFRWFCTGIYFASLAGSAFCLVVVPFSYTYVDWLRTIVVPLGDLSAVTGMGVIIGIIVINKWISRRTAGQAKARPNDAPPLQSGTD